MKRPAVFFDRDNTLIVGSDYLGDPDDVVLMPGAADAISRARALGYATVVVSNQSGVARGMFAEADVRAVNARVEEYLREENPSAIIDRQEFCPFHPEGGVERYRKDSDLRKPKPGMITKAAELLALDLSRSWLIGDAPRDIEAGKAAGCRTILFQDRNLPASPAASATPTVLPDHFVQSLKDAIDIIERDGQTSEPSQGNASKYEQGPIAAAEDPMRLPTTPMSAAPPAPAIVVDVARLEALLEQVLQELRRSAPSSPGSMRSGAPVAALPAFSITKMLGGVMQVLALSVLALAYRAENAQTSLLLAIMLQVFTIALLIMGRQR